MPSAAVLKALASIAKNEPPDGEKALFRIQRGPYKSDVYFYGMRREANDLAVELDTNCVGLHASVITRGELLGHAANLTKQLEHIQDILRESDAT